MKSKTIKTAIGMTAIALFIASNTMAGGPISFSWDNDSSIAADFEAPLYLSTGAPTTLDPVGSPIALVAVQGGTNYVLASSTIGQSPAGLNASASANFISAAPYNGLFDIASSVSSQIVAGAVGSPLGVAFGPNNGLIVNLTITVPSPNYVTAPASPTVFELDTENAAFTGGNVASGITSGSESTTTQGAKGYYNVVPEPSSIMLVGMGLAGLLAIRRRRS